MKMMKIKTTFIILALTTAILLPVSTATAQALKAGPDDPVELEAFIGNILTTQLTANNIAGASVSVIKDGQVIFIEGYGYADVAQGILVDPHSTLFPVASITKLFTWTAVMQLVEEGLLDLDEDVNNDLDFSIPNTYDDPVTLRHLMTHTGGFEDRAYGIAAATPDSVQPLGSWLASHIPTRIYPPGEVIAYSNYGAALAGYIVERVSEMPFASYLEQQILKPLDMVHTSLRQPLPDSLQANLAQGYTYYEGLFNAKEAELENTAPAGGLSTTAADMAAFMMANLQGSEGTDTPILRSESLKTMHAQAWSLDARSNGMALGFIEMDRNGQTVIGHDGDILYAHSLMVLLPEDDLGLFLVYNSASAAGLPQDLYHAFMDHYYPLPPLEFSSLEADLSRVAGRYDWSRTNSSTPEQVESLFSEVRFVATDDGLLKTTTPGSTLRMAQVEPLFFRDVHTGATMVFSEDEQGRIQYASHSDWPDMMLIRQVWYQADTLHLAVLIAVMAVYIITLLSLIVRFIVRQIQKRDALQQMATRYFWWAHLCAGLSAIALLVSIFSLFDNYTVLLQGEVSSMGLQIPAIVIIASAIAGSFFTIRAWKSGIWNRFERISYALVTFISVVFIGWLAYWNLLFIRF
jgi:CubicO group peptidase (beta-lactamase class C family)